MKKNVQLAASLSFLGRHSIYLPTYIDIYVTALVHRSLIELYLMSIWSDVSPERVCSEAS